MATETLAKWATSLSYSDLPESVIRAAIRSFYNWVGCAIGGSLHTATTIAHSSLEPFFGSPQSSLLGSQGGMKADAQHAALLNGIASHVHDYDDTHLDTIIHPTGLVASALLAVSEWKRPVSGRDFILALVAGIEAECKLGLAVWPHHYDIGWHITSTTGSVGAAVAVGKVLGLDVVAMQHATGVAATQVTGLREMFGSHTKSFHLGRAAQNGLVAAVMAGGGFTSSLRALEAKRGWVNVVSTENRLEEVLASLGTRWEVERNAFKPFPCGIVVHPVVDGCVQARSKLADASLRIEDVEVVDVHVHPLVLELTGKTEPKDGLEGKFSVYHGAAVGLLYGKATPAEYEDFVVLDPAVIEVRRKTRATVDESLRAGECHVRLDLGDNKIFEVHVDHAVGSLQSPMSDGQLQAKFLDQCGPVLGDEGASNASDACWGLKQTQDVAGTAATL
ncbi:hypothetical protein LTS18_008884 [Coniosporium uncinatum]|uniref:Uncharacterized protein n=1 Tax=Coniosporium uncinatum TaxID=93489 RepID=A0ACC3DMX3_9PEZI|nr:hypothetical protein LTS18_008884 [Coniosporium uncinatum]